MKNNLYKVNDQVIYNNSMYYVTNVNPVESDDNIYQIDKPSNFLRLFTTRETVFDDSLFVNVSALSLYKSNNNVWEPIYNTLIRYHNGQLVFTACLVKGEYAVLECVVTAINIRQTAEYDIIVKYELTPVPKEQHYAVWVEAAAIYCYKDDCMAECIMSVINKEV